MLFVVGLAIAALNIAYWNYALRGGLSRFRVWVERRFNVVISIKLEGRWQADGDGSKWRLFAIEMLQLAYLFAAFLGWVVLVLICVGVIKLLDGSAR